ncbi:YpiF family protein [Ornithinibacillus salinisoli]|uniref:YpiF family protein n=1 Tax=Ornithinibacillus salinisoli TaxID=1848459 RepID=A0ABW4W420_9BACI
MKWNEHDMEKYMQAKEYIDTIILPLIPFHLSQEASVKKNAFASEVLTIFSSEIEKELTGRIVLTPSYYYVKNADKEPEVDRLNAWVDDMKEQPFQHIFFISFDSKWKKHEKDLNGNLIWLPGFQSGDVQSVEMQQVIREQVKQIVELIRSYW